MSFCGRVISDYISYLPHLNACLNGTSALLLFTGYSFIRAAKCSRSPRVPDCGSRGFASVSQPRISHITINHGSTRFQGTGLVRPIYFTILTSHTILAIVIVPLVMLTFYRAFRNDFGGTGASRGSPCRSGCTCRSRA